MDLKEAVDKLDEWRKEDSDKFKELKNNPEYQFRAGYSSGFHDAYQYFRECSIGMLERKYTDMIVEIDHWVDKPLDKPIIPPAHWSQT